MPRNGSGTYTRAVSDYVNATTIDETEVNSEMDDIATALTASIAKDGQTPTTAVIPFASGIKTNTIVENTAASGVTIDSVLLKDAGVTLGTAGTLIFEGATDDAFETTVTVTDPTADRTITLPDATGTVLVTGQALVDVVDDTTPQLGGQLDVNGNAIGDGTRELLTFTEDGSAVNHVNIENQATGGGPIISAAGDDTNVPLLLLGKGTGAVQIGDANLAFPDADGTSGQAIVTDAAGTLSFSTVGGDFEHVSTAGIAAQTTAVVTGLASGYDYKIVLEAFAPTTDNEQLWMRFSDDAGATYEADASDYAWGAQLAGTGSDSSADTKIILAGNTVAFGNDAGNQSLLEITIINPQGTSEDTMAHWSGVIYDTAATPNLFAIQGGASFTQGTDAVDAVQFLWSGGSTFKAQGDVTVWRRKRS